MQAQPLCKITYSIAEQSHSSNQEQKFDSKNLISRSVPVISGMSTYQIAQIVGNNLGCGYIKEIQQQICQQLRIILYQAQSNITPDSLNNFQGDQQTWRSEMKKVIQTSYIYRKNYSQLMTLSEKRNLNKNYFQLNYDKFFKCQSIKNIHFNRNKQNILNIYQRSLIKKKQTEDKLSMFKKKKNEQQIYQCTFSPNINNTVEFFNKNNPKFFEKQFSQNSTFQRLYKQSFDLRQKKKQRMKTLQNQQQAKLSQCSFFPVINQCSRQICRIKSHVSFISELSDTNDKKTIISLKSNIKTTHNKKFTSRQKNNELKNQRTQKKTKQKSKFQSKITQKTRKLTKCASNFFQRQESKQKIHQIKETKQSQKKLQNRIQIKKQTYTIEDDQNYNDDYLQTQKKQLSLLNNQKINYLFNKEDINQEQPNLQNKHITQTQKVQQRINTPVQIKNQLQNTSKIHNVQKRSHELFNNRKNIIFQTIFKYLSYNPSISINQFSKSFSKLKRDQSRDENQSEMLEIGRNNIENNSYLPTFIKQILQPISSQLNQLNISLNKDQFLWAIQKLFDELSYADRGSFLGWGVKLLPLQSK